MSAPGQDRDPGGGRTGPCLRTYSGIPEGGKEHMRTALASDFDNTLYFHNTEERFYAQDIFEILFFQKRGGLFGICTGRSPDSILDMTGNFLHPDSMPSVLCTSTFRK